MDLDAIDAAKPAKQEVIEQFFVDPDRSFSAIVVIEPAAADRTGDRFDPNYHTVSGVNFQTKCNQILHPIQVADLLQLGLFWWVEFWLE